LFAYACYAAVIVGHWPYYAQPDPKELPLRPLLSVVGYITAAGAMSVLVLPLMFAICRYYARWRNVHVSKQRRVPTILYLAGAALWIADLTLTFTDHQSLVSWIID